MFRDFEEHSGGGWGSGPPFDIAITNNHFAQVSVRFFTLDATVDDSPAVFCIDNPQGHIRVHMHNCFVAPLPHTISFSLRARIAWDYFRGKHLLQADS